MAQPRAVPLAEEPDQRPAAALRGAGGGGTFEPMEARVAALEAHVTHIQSDVDEIKHDLRDLRADTRIDFRILFGAIISVALGLAGLMAKGFHWF